MASCLCLDAVSLNWSTDTSAGHKAAWTCLRTNVMLLLLWDILSKVAGGLPSPMAMLTSWNEVFEACITCKATSTMSARCSAAAIHSVLHNLLEPLH